MMIADDGGEEARPQDLSLDEIIIRDHEDRFDETDPHRGLFDPEHDLDESEEEEEDDPLNL